MACNTSIMTDVTSRILRLLTLLQSHRHWSGPELATTLNVTERTIRRDIDRLRELGYRIDSLAGSDGGYRLESGTGMPPLLLTDDEAVAMAIGLRITASQQLITEVDATITALTKLERMLPARLRRRVSALNAAINKATSFQQDTGVSAETLGLLAVACRTHERVRFRYTSASGEVTHRLADPYVLVPKVQRWYVLCWDEGRDDWRTFRVDRLSGLELTGVRCEPRELDARDVEKRLMFPARKQRRRHEVQVTVALSAEEAQARFGRWVPEIEKVGENQSRWCVQVVDTYELVHALWWMPAGVDYTVEVAEPLRSAFQDTLERMTQAAGGGQLSA